MTFPGFDHLYQIRDPFNRRAFRGSLLDQADPWGEAWIRAEKLPTRAVRMQHAMGSHTPQDCIWTTSQALIVHKQVIEEMTRAGLTGWTTYPVIVSTQPVRLYDSSNCLGFAVTGRCGRLDYSRGTWVNWKSASGTEIPVLRGLRFDETTWTGTDFFAPSTPGLLKVFSTDAGRAVLGRFGNVDFTALTAIEIEEASLPKDAKLPPRQANR
jgi:hypothetical protein